MLQQRFLTPDRLYDRPFSAGHPFGRRPSSGRRWGMLTIFVLLCSLIGAYLWITDANRVRMLAQSELTRIIGGRVTVGHAKLSIFEGLRLDSVNVYVDDSNAPDSTLFSANQFLVSYDPKALLTGRLKLTQIIAIDPHVQLTENLDTGRWNYQRMIRPQAQTTGRATAGSLPPMPEIILRNAQIDYAEVRAGEQTSRGTLAIEGQFAPTSDPKYYSFELQSRGGGSDGQINVGPTITGTLRRDSGEVTARLRDFRFGQDIRSMLPAQVRSWWDRHGLAGALDVSELTYIPANAGRPDAKFHTTFKLDDVTLTIRPEEWMSRDEIQTQQWAASAIDSLASAGMNAHGVIDVLGRLIEPAPIQLGHVKGIFIFTENGILIDKVTGALNVPGAKESNLFAIDGQIQGYSPLSPASITVASTHVEIPRSPRYITSMPRQVRELYDHLRPHGLCTLQVSVERPANGGRIEVAGEVRIVDGNFVFDKFPYPVRAASGRIVFGYDPASGMDQVKLIDLRGKGAAGGPNANANIHLSGLIEPLTSEAGVSIVVTADDVRDEPLLFDSYPSEVRQALKNLDADGRGDFPKYRGSFECRVNRPIGHRSPWIIETDVTLRDAAGKFVAFPYFMEHVSGQLAIREGYVDIINATMKKNDASLTIDGRVAWRAGVGGRPVEVGETIGQVTRPRPDLKITARSVPIDDALLDALPEDRRQWMRKAGLTGVIDIDGRVWRASPSDAPVARINAESELTHSFDITLRDGKIWPSEGTYAATNLTARMHLAPDRLTIADVRARRGAEGELTGRGEVSWPGNKPNVFFSGTAAKLELDRTLYNVLPSAGKQAWDAVKPEGVVDIDMTYRGAVVEERVSGIGYRVSGGDKLATSSDTRHPTPDTRPSSDLDLIIHPRKLAATVQAVPYHLTDITGAVRVSSNHVTLTDLAARHGAGTIRVSGSGNVGAGANDWDLRLSGDAVRVDDEFRKALPPALASLIESLKLEGKLSFDFSKLAVRNASGPVASKTATGPSDSKPLDVDFALKLGMSDAAFDVGVPFTAVKGNLGLEGTVRNNKLAALSGPIDLASAMVADRTAQDLHAEFYKPADQDGLHIGQLNGQLAGGAIAGSVNLVFPEGDTSKYEMNLVLRNADVREVSGMTEGDLSGEMSASLALQGDWSDIRSRRGRGDVAVAGKQMYKIPLVLGLLQITNLSLPITSPFNEGSARYSVDGQMVTFESLELRSRNMLMSGSGQLNFANKKVAMTFTTDNPNWPKLPIIGDIVQTAKHELLQIHVRGTLSEPKTQVANTVTTTVDEVMQGNKPQQPPPQSQADANK